jgi:orotidine-5'-phosphate decarboxylase
MLAGLSIPTRRMTFSQKLEQAWERSGSLVCVGLDPDLGRLPTHLSRDAAGVLAFHRAIVDATHDLVCAYKPQIAYFAAEGLEDTLAATIDYIRERAPHVPVILDAKRGDIGSTAEQYAREAFERYRADAVTVNPYLGGDTLEPFLRHTDRGVVILCRTSNPGAGDFQDLDVNGRPLYEIVAERAATQWNSAGNCLLVVGATWPQQLARVRAIVGDMPLLVPGVGAQGGDVEQLVRAGRTAAGTGLLINSSRAILYASRNADFAQAARAATLELQQLINRQRAA